MRAKAGRSPSGSARGGGRGEQMVLSTAGASWALRKRTDGPGSAERPRKKSRVDVGEAAVEESENMEVDKDEGREARDADEGRVEDESLEVKTPDSPDTELSHGPVDEDKRMEEEMPEVIDMTVEDDGDVSPTAAPRATRSNVDSSSVSATSDEIVCTGELRERLVDALREREDREHERDAKAKLNGTPELANTNDEEVVEALSWVIDKPDFASMEVVGRFNLGLIIVRRRPTPGLSPSPVPVAASSVDPWKVPVADVAVTRSTCGFGVRTGEALRGEVLTYIHDPATCKINTNNGARTGGVGIGRLV
ncbi:hypothetical protein BD309DRAFT_1085219 [Dichomitus squalens]|nr:hypothetical protein BD309DRAFT_1085219 [Dichomitus squalens]